MRFFSYIWKIEDIFILYLKNNEVYKEASNFECQRAYIWRLAKKDAMKCFLLSSYLFSLHAKLDDIGLAMNQMKGCQINMDNE